MSFVQGHYVPVVKPGARQKETEISGDPEISPNINVSVSCLAEGTGDLEKGIAQPHTSRGRRWTSPEGSGSGPGRPAKSITDLCTLGKAGSSLWVTFLHLGPQGPQEPSAQIHTCLIFCPPLHHRVNCLDLIFLER